MSVRPPRLLRPPAGRTDSAIIGKNGSLKLAGSQLICHGYANGCVCESCLERAAAREVVCVCDRPLEGAERRCEKCGRPMGRRVA